MAVFADSDHRKMCICAHSIMRDGNAIRERDNVIVAECGLLSALRIMEDLKNRPRSMSSPLRLCAKVRMFVFYSDLESLSTSVC